jgi:hypothetical protein
MPLNIETFNNIHGGNAFFKAISHPLVAPKVGSLFRELKGCRVAIYDPLNQIGAFAQFYDAASLPIAGYYIQDIEKRDAVFANHKAQLVTQLKNSNATHVLIAAFDAAKMADHIRHLVPDGAKIISFDDLRLPPEMVTERKQYLSPLNFATNFVFFRDAGGHHTRYVSANYWGGYGAKEPRFWCRLFDANGEMLHTWEEKLGVPQSLFTLDSKEIRARFNLPEFNGQLFVHAIGIAGHDIVKYALDTYGDDETILSCTHDANSWPSDFYAGLPAPDVDEDVVLWVQNSQPFDIPAGEIGLGLMGSEDVVRLQKPVPAFSTCRLSVADLLPKARWPQQVEVHAGKYFVRPRYEVFAKNGRQRIAHVNVERSDLKPDPKLAEIGALMGKGHILPSPILPLDRFNSLVLPTPMDRHQQHLPLKALIFDAGGQQMAEHAFGNLPRSHASLLDIKAALKKSGAALPGGYGHVELVYDFDVGREADGWMHGLFRFVDEQSGHKAESSFGSHIFNTVLTYRNEPQSYVGRPPGLSTRLFLRVGDAPYDTFCHLIYPASTPWHTQSETALILTSGQGQEVASKPLSIPCGGSRFWKVSEMFQPEELHAAGQGAYITIRDVTCRLFGYHGLMQGKASFCLDHMFGF